MLKNVVALIVLLGVSACAPPAVPGGASLNWGWIDGPYWTWTRRLQHGCAAWMAKEAWANVELVIDSRCEGRGEDGYLAGRGLTYSSVSDYLVFRGYWPWTAREYFNLTEFDDHGMTSRILPCPHSLSPGQLNELRSLAQEALGAATTDAERSMLTRVRGRLAAVNGTTLASGQEGCTDLPPDWWRGSFPRQDPWTLR